MKTQIVRAFNSLILMVTVTCMLVQANAQMLTFEFSGTLTEVMNDPLGYADSWGTVGDPFTGYLSYDPTFWKNNPDGDGYGSSVNGSEEEYYVRGEPAYTLEAAITFLVSTPSFTGQIPGAAPSSMAWVNNSPGEYSFIVTGELSSTEVLSLNFNDATGAGLAGTNLPTTLDLDNWTGADYFAATISDIGPGYVQGDINSLQLIPEPRAEMMIGLGIIAWCLSRRQVG